MGTFIKPPDMYLTFAALLKIWSNVIQQKLQNINSTTGRIPIIAAPTARPEKAASTDRSTHHFIGAKLFKQL